MFIYSYCYLFSLLCLYILIVMYSHCYVYLFLLLCILIVVFIYSYCYVYVFLLLSIFRSKYFVSLCCFVYYLCVNVYCTAATGCQPSRSLQIYHITSTLSNSWTWLYVTAVLQTICTLNKFTHFVSRHPRLLAKYRRTQF